MDSPNSACDLRSANRGVRSMSSCTAGHRPNGHRVDSTETRDCTTFSRRSRKPECPHGYPGFKSLSVCFGSRSKTQALSQKPRVLSGFLCVYGPRFCLSRFALRNANECRSMQNTANCPAPIRAHWHHRRHLLRVISHEYFQITGPKNRCTVMALMMSARHNRYVHATRLWIL
jgi:hypothetical protein